MATELLEIATQMRERLSAFLTDNLERPHYGWPRRASEPSNTPAGCAARRRGGVKVLIIGDLAIELPFVVDAPKSELLKPPRAKRRRKSPVWSMGEPRVGGFVAHAVKAAAALGAEIHVRTVLPVPILPCFRRFIEDYGIDQRQLRALPGPCPVVLQIRCNDGSFKFRRPGVASALSFAESADRECYDVILADPNCSAHRRSIIDCLASFSRSEGGPTLVGVYVDDAWSRDELNRIGRQNIWAFVDDDQARSLMSRHGCTSGVCNDDVMVRAVKNAYGIGKVVMLRGPRGAVLMNSDPDPHRARPCPLQSTHTLACAATLMATATISSLAGADDATSLRRGVTAATGLLAGLDLPNSLDELDAGT